MKKILLLALVMLGFSALSHAQTPQESPVNTDLPNSEPPVPSVVYPLEVFQMEVLFNEIYDPDPTPVVYSPDVYGDLSSGVLRGSFEQNASWDYRNNFGFSLGAQRSYFTEKSGDNPIEDSTRKRSSSGTSLFSSVFTNYARGKSSMHLDYGANYSFYPGRENSVDDINHRVSAAFNYRIANIASFQITDSFTSSSNDPFGDIFSAGSSMGMSFGNSSFFDFIFASRRYSRNTAMASLSADVTGKGTFASLFVTHSNYWHGNHDEQGAEFGLLEDYYSTEVGVRVNQRITNWLSLGSSYSVQLNENLDDTRTHRVEVGRFQFKLSENVEVYVSGGVDITKSRGSEDYHTTATTNAGINYSTPMNNLYANYTRSMRTVSGYRLTLPSDTVTVGMGQPLGERTNLRVTGYYQRSTTLNSSGILNIYQGTASLEVLIVSGLFASANYSYRYQKNSIDMLGGIPHIERQTFSGGLNYVWPSRRQ